MKNSELKILVERTPSKKVFSILQDKKLKFSIKTQIFHYLLKTQKINQMEIFFLIIFNITYLMTLTKCYGTDEECINSYRYLLYVLPILMIVSISIWLFYFISNLKKKKNINIFFWIFNLLCYYVFCKGYRWRGHGTFNMLFSLSIISWYFFFYFIFILFKKGFEKNKRVFGTFIFCIFFVVVFFFVKRFLLTNDYFYQGFKGTKLINNDKLCKFRNFYLNVHEGTKGLFLFFPIFFSSCSKNYIPKWKKYDTIYEYPDTRKFDTKTRKYPEMISEKIQTEMKMLPKGQKPTSEFWVDFTKKTPEFKMQIIPNKKKQQIQKKNKTNSNFKGLYILFIDALSRSNLLRMYPSIFNYLEKFYKNKNSEYEVFQFFRFHSRKPWTSPNVGVWRYGSRNWNNNKIDITPKLKNIETEFSEKNYITAHGDGFCKTRVTDWHTGDKVEKNIEDSKWDHEFIGPACDEEIFDYIDPYGPIIGPYSSVRRCLFGNDISSYMLDYFEKFHKIYKNEKTISSLELSDNHELTREVPNYIQKRLLKHFENILENKMLNGKSNILLADHGQHMTPIIKDFTSGVVEQFNPILILILPRHIADKYRDVLRQNEQKLIGMMDVREVMFFLASGESKNSGGVNFVTDLVEESRLPDEIGVAKENWQCFQP